MNCYANPLDMLRTEARDTGDVYPALHKAIVELYVQPGVILSIKDLSDHFEVGRSPIRDALLRLHQEGLVVLLPQRGTMISLIDFSRVEQERFLRLSVEEEVMKNFIACHTPSDILLLQELLRQQKELCSAKEIDTRHFLWLDDEFHRVFYQVTNKLFCFDTIQSIGGHYRRARLLTCGKGEKLEEIIMQHDALITALQARDTDLMCDILHHHLRKVDREENSLLRQYVQLFKRKNSPNPIQHLWNVDYLQSLKK